MKSLLAQAYTTLTGWADGLRWLPPLLMRICLGYLFFISGLPKIEHPAQFAQTFAGWGIPHPYFNALLAGYTEVIGGLLLIGGLATRIASIPLVIDMIVAIVTVQMNGVGGFADFVALDDPVYALVFFWLIINGPGAISLDYLVKRYAGRWLGIERPATDAASAVARAAPSRF